MSDENEDDPYAKKYSKKNYRFKDSSDSNSDDEPMEAGYDSL